MWKEYLDYEIARGDEKRILILFERCLIACALYEEYWIKYVKYLQSKPEKDVTRLRDVFKRACTIHHRSKPWINLLWAAFEESEGKPSWKLMNKFLPSAHCVHSDSKILSGNLEKAAEVLETLETAIPNSLHLFFGRINLERRRGDVQKASELFQKYIADERNKATVGHIKIKYSRFLVRVTELIF